jgi:hypothetical protein
MKQQTRKFMNLALLIIVVPILGFFIFMLPIIMSGLAEVIAVPAYLKYPGLIALYAAIVPFLFVVYQIVKQLINVIKNKAFSQISVKALKNIKYCTLAISALYVLAMPLLFILADKDDAPGIILFGSFVIFMNGVSAVLAASYEKKLS